MINLSCTEPFQQMLRLVEIKVTDQIAGKWKTTFNYFINELSTGSTKFLYKLEHRVFEVLNFAISNESKKVAIERSVVQF